MLIDETNIPVNIYLSSVNVDAVDNQILSENHGEHGDAIGINDNIDDEVKVTTMRKMSTKRKKKT